MAINDNIMKWKNIRGEVNEIKKLAIDADAKSTEAIAKANTCVAAVAAMEHEVNGLVGIEVEDIEALTPEQLNALEPYCTVIKVSGAEKHTYHVVYLKRDEEDEDVGELALVYADYHTIEEIYYEKQGEEGEKEWAFVSKEIIDLSKLATKAYVNDAVAGLASETYVNDAVDGLASETYVNDAIALAITGAINDTY